MRSPHGLGILVLVCLGCGADPMVSLKSRSAFDLKCPADQIQLTPLTPCGAWHNGTCTVGVTGCGRQATYVDPVNGSGNWIMNNSASQSGNAQSPTP
jgi:hypothetical protein